MILLEHRLLLAFRRAVITALLAFAISAPFGALFGILGRLFASPPLVNTGFIVPAVALIVGLVSGAWKVFSLPRRKFTAWLDLHCNAKGALAASGEIPHNHPLYAEIVASARESVKRAGRSYLEPFLPAWAPLVLAAGALWGLAFIVPESQRQNNSQPPLFGGIMETGTGAAPDTKTENTGSWQKIFLLANKPNTDTGILPNITAALPDWPSDISTNSDNNTGTDSGEGARTGENDTVPGGGSSEGTSDSTQPQEYNTGVSAPQKSAPAEIQLPLPWDRIAIRYSDITRNNPNSEK